MEEIIIKLSKGQYLSEIEPFRHSGIPSDCILYKEITGCGATESELRSERNSIIIVAHQPVIKDKVKVHNKANGAEKQILAVLKGVDEYKIESYLNSSAVYKKILVTPESFKKILNVFANDLDTLYSEYFLLFDECDRIVTDVSYRGKITAPIDKFDKFTNKALVSATPIEFSHPVLSKLKKYVIQPDYKYSKPIKVIGTNNVTNSLARHLSEISREQPVFFFVNSTNCILDIIDILNVREESYVYCGEKSVAQLLSSKYKRASSELDLKKLDSYVFLTSRYFAALDIKLDFKPHVILVTDVYTADHSILDPSTDIIQIAGRFRNGLSSLTHIANFKPELDSKNKDEAMAYLKGVFDTHKQVIELLTRLDYEASSAALRFFTKESPTSDYYTEEGQVNDFMVDNYIYVNRVKGYYQSFNNLQAAYAEKSNHFDTTFKEEQYLLGDKDRAYRNSRLSIKDKQRETFRQLDKFNLNNLGKSTVSLPNDLQRNLRSLYPALTEIYDLIGLEGMERANFNSAQMLKYKKAAQEIKDIRRLQPLIYDAFKASSERFNEEIKVIMPRLFKQASIKTNPTISFLSNYFEISRTTNSGKNVTIIGERKDLSNLSPFE